MDFFGFGSSSQKETPDATSTIDKLSDRVRDATLLEDRRSAVQGLRGLARDWQLQVGTKGMPALVKVLRTDRMDVEIIKLALETLNLLCSNNSNDKENLGSALTEMFVKDSSNVALLLDILAEIDFYVRFNTIQLLNTLFTNVGSALHEGILTSPLGISRLIDLLDDKREIIRNDGLLLLISLTAQNADIQKIVAFENAFERLFSIIFEEGAIEGGIIVQDCLQLMQHLLRYNASNQNLFRETSCIKMVPKLLVSTTEVPGKGMVEMPISDPATNWHEQKLSNTLFVLELVRILVTGNNQNATTNQNLLGQSNMVMVLFQAAVEPLVPKELRSQAFLAVGDLIANNELNRDRFGKCVVQITQVSDNIGLPNQKPPPGHPTDSTTALIETALEKNDFALRAGAMYAFRSYLDDNMDVQIKIATLLNPVPANRIGKVLIESCLNLDRKDALRGWFASNMLMHALFENAHAKDVALAVVFDEHGEKISLLNKICYALLCAQRDNCHPRITIGLLALLTVWLFDNTKAVQEFLSEGSNMQFLIEQINQSSGIDPVVQGLSCFLYSIIHQFTDDSEQMFSQSSLQNLVQSRIGVDIFNSRVQRLKETKAFNHTDAMNFDEGEIIFDPAYLEFIKTHLDFIVRMVTIPQTKPQKARPEESSRLAELEALLAQKDQEINELQQALQQLEPTTQSNLNQEELDIAYKELESICADQQEKIQQLETDQEDLFLCLADQELEIGNLKAKLKGYGEVFDDE